MKITPTSNNTFQGYNARVLKGFIMSTNCHNIASEMKSIGQKEGFKIFTPTPFIGSQKKCIEKLPEYTTNTSYVWAQDMWTLVKDKLHTLETSNDSDAIKECFGLEYDTIQQKARDLPMVKILSKELNKLREELSYEPDSDFWQFNRMMLRNQLEEKIKSLETIHRKTHITGGNVFILEDQILVGENELKKFKPEEMKQMFNTNKVTVLPQMDYHLDLFIRPLDKNRILLADDRLSLKALEEGLCKISNYIRDKSWEEKEEYSIPLNRIIDMYERFTNIIDNNPFPSTEEVEKILLENNLEVIRVPGRLYSICLRDDGTKRLKHYCNFMNANALINKDGDLVYITNHSEVDLMLGIMPEMSEAINFSFKDSFINSISPYVKKEKIYFVRGEDNFLPRKMLPEYQGGIHCVCTEVPEDLG